MPIDGFASFQKVDEYRAKEWSTMLYAMESVFCGMQAYLAKQAPYGKEDSSQPWSSSLLFCFGCH